MYCNERLREGGAFSDGKDDKYLKHTLFIVMKWRVKQTYTDT